MGSVKQKFQAAKGIHLLHFTACSIKLNHYHHISFNIMTIYITILFILSYYTILMWLAWNVEHGWSAYLRVKAKMQTCPTFSSNFLHSRHDTDAKVCNKYRCFG